MKSEHRHELAENDLNKLLGRWGEQFDKHANTILSVLIAITLIAAGLIYWNRTSADTSAAGWTQLSSAGSTEDFQNVANDFPGTPVAQWATLRAASGALQEGIRLSLTDRPASIDRLEQARSSFKSLLDNQSIPETIREQALNSYAVTLETLSDGDTTDAIAAYEALKSQFPHSRFAPFADDRVASLKTGGTQDFYAWFHRQNPKPADIPLPNDQPKLPDPSSLGAMLPELGGSGVPDVAPLNLPPIAGDDKAGDDEKGDGKAGGDEKMTGDEKKAPAEEKNPFAEAEAKEKEKKDAKDAKDTKEATAKDEKKDATPAETPDPKEGADQPAEEAEKE